MDRKLVDICDVFNVLTAFKPNYDISKSSKPACLAIIQLNSIVQKQINIAKPIYDEISKYSQ